MTIARQYYADKTYELTGSQIEEMLWMQSRQTLDAAIEHMNNVRPDKTYTARTILRKADLQIERAGIPFPTVTSEGNRTIRDSLTFFSLCFVTFAIFIWVLS
jgi:hypothetical protein